MRTLFSLGGRGYFENAASDLLAFFMVPDGEHGLGGLFLDAFLRCAGHDAARLDFAGVTISRESVTPEGKRLDLVMSSRDWVLLIENKIYHCQNNPFDTYEAYGRSIAGNRTLLFAVLLPQGVAIRDNWPTVTYRDYCVALRRGMDAVGAGMRESKWLLFAKEFVLHLETELYQPEKTMTLEEADFVERNAAAIQKITELSKDYRQFLGDTLKARVSEQLPLQPIAIKDEGWALRCFAENWGRSNIALWTTPPGSTPSQFNVNVYLIGLVSEQAKSAAALFKGMKHWQEGAWLAWGTDPGLDTREEALHAAGEVAKKVATLFSRSTSPMPLVP